MFDVYRKAKESGHSSPFELGIHRTDYLVERDERGGERPLMVEMNTIASSMGGHAVGVGEMHRAIGTCKPADFLENGVVKSISGGIERAVREYAKYFGRSLDDLCVVTLREEGGSVNFSDQKRFIVPFDSSIFYAPLMSAKRA